MIYLRFVDDSWRVWTFTWEPCSDFFAKEDLNSNRTWAISDIIVSPWWSVDTWCSRFMSIQHIVHVVYAFPLIKPIKESFSSQAFNHTHTHFCVKLFIIYKIYLIYIYTTLYIYICLIICSAYFDLFCCSLCLIIGIIFQPILCFESLGLQRALGSHRKICQNREPDGVVDWKPGCFGRWQIPVKEQVSCPKTQQKVQSDRETPRNKSFSYTVSQYFHGSVVLPPLGKEVRSHFSWIDTEWRSLEEVLFGHPLAQTKYERDFLTSKWIWGFLLVGSSTIVECTTFRHIR